MQSVAGTRGGSGSTVTVAGIDKATGTDADGRTERTERRLERLKRMPVAHPDIGCFFGILTYVEAVKIKEVCFLRCGENRSVAVKKSHTRYKEQTKSLQAQVITSIMSG